MWRAANREISTHCENTRPNTPRHINRRGRDECHGISGLPSATLTAWLRLSNLRAWQRNRKRKPSPRPFPVGRERVAEGRVRANPVALPPSSTPASSIAATIWNSSPSCPTPAIPHSILFIPQLHWPAAFNTTATGTPATASRSCSTRFSAKIGFKVEPPARRNANIRHQLAS